MDLTDADLQDDIAVHRSRTSFRGAVYSSLKRVFDLSVSLVFLMPLMLVCGAVLLVLNRFWNRGPLFFAQERMGQGCVPFTAYKFRSMRPASKVVRTADCPLEADRITPLGRFLRQTRIDELPQIINVFKGEMSLIGPRPDYITHAREYLAHIPGYRTRHQVRPGITGWAQVELGYVEGKDATRRKVQADIYYINNASIAMDGVIVWRTVTVMLRGGGA